MRVFARLLSVFTLLLFPIGGCNEVTAPTTARVNLFIAAADGEEAGQPVPGARVCELDTTTNCKVTDPDGRVTIEIPFEVESGYTVEKEGYASDLYPDIIPLNGSTNQRSLRTDAFMAAQHDRVGSPYPMRFTGSIWIGTFGAPGVTFELVEATGTAFYVEELTGPDDEVTDWSLDLTETTSTGLGGFTEVSPGEFLISLGGASGCTAGLAWPVDDENTIKLPVREGFVTRANTFACREQP